MTEAKWVRAVTALNAIDPDDPEHAHGEADKILLALVHPDVREAYRQLAEDRCAWWVTA